MLGVTLIAAWMSFQKSHDVTIGQGLVPPAVPAATAAPVSDPVPGPVATVQPAAAPGPNSDPSLIAAQVGKAQATRDAAPKSPDRKEAIRRGMLPKDLPRDVPPAPPPPPPRAVEPPPTKAPTVPTKPKDVDFGI